LIWNRLSGEQRRRFRDTGVLMAPSAYEAEMIPLNLGLVEEGRRHLVLRGPIPLGCPVRLLHGMRDADVPYPTSLRLAQRIEGAEVVVELIEDGDHRLSRPQDLERLFAVIDGLSRRAQP